MRSGFGAASRLPSVLHAEPGLLREVADEEIDLGELRRGDDLALEIVDPLDVAAHDEPVGAARVADLRRHDRVELAAVRRQHVDRRHRRRRSCPSFSSDQFSSSLIVSFTLKPCFLKKTEFSFGSRPPLAAMSPA